MVRALAGDSTTTSVQPPVRLVAGAVPVAEARVDRFEIVLVALAIT